MDLKKHVDKLEKNVRKIFFLGLFFVSLGFFIVVTSLQEDNYILLLLGFLMIIVGALMVNMRALIEDLRSQIRKDSDKSR